MANAKSPSEAGAVNFGEIVVHLGAGECSELDRFLEGRPGKVVLVEADPEISEDLRIRTQDLPGVVVVNKVIGVDTGAVSFRRFNFSDANSIAKPAGILNAFPGLKQVDEVRSNAIGVNEFLDTQGLNEFTRRHLVINLTGIEGLVVEALLGAGRLPDLDKVELTIGNECLYEGAKTLDDAVLLFQSNGFRLLEKRASDPEYSHLTFEKDPVALENIHLKKEVGLLKAETKRNSDELASLSGSIDEKTAAIDELKAKLKESQAVLADTRRELESVLKSKAEAEALLTSELAEVRGRNKQFVDERDRDQKKIKELTNELGSIRQLAKDSKSEIASLTVKVSGLEENSRRALSANQELSAELEKLNAKEAEWVDRVRALKEANEAQDLLINAGETELAKLAEESLELKRRTKSRGQTIEQVQVENARVKNVLQDLERKIEKIEVEARSSAESFGRANSRLEATVEEKSRLSEALNKSHDEVTELRHRLSTLTEEMEAMGKEKRKYESEKSELAGRQRMLDREIDRAEAQIDLIKEVLLRDLGI